MLKLHNGDLIDPKSVVAIRVMKAIKKDTNYLGSKSCKPRVIVNWGSRTSLCYFNTLWEAKEYQDYLHSALLKALK